MKLQKIRMAAFKNASLANLMAYVNNFTEGVAVSAANSGTVDYAANEVGQRELIDQKFFFISGEYVCILFYAR
jgi:hypothetical protein